MPVFPTQYSVLSAEALGSFIALRFGFEVASCRLLIHNVSDTYLVVTPVGKFIFKIYRKNHRSEEQIAEEMRLLLYFHDNGLPVSYPLKDSEGGLLQRFEAAEGLRFGVLLSFASGEVVHDMNDKQLRLLGKEMARFHQLSSSVAGPTCRAEYTLNAVLIDPLKVIKPAFEGLEEQYRYLEEAVTTALQSISRLDLSGFSSGYCHFDFLPKNFHFDNEHTLTFFDFDFLGRGYLIFDITSFYIHYFLEVMQGRCNREEADRRFGLFIEAYREVKPVTDEELSAIKYFGLGFWMFYFRFHYDNYDDWSNFFFTPKFIKERTQLIRKWMEY